MVAIGLAAAAVTVELGLVAGALLYVASEAGILQQALGWLSGVFGTLLDTAKMTFGGIMDAMAAGQFVLAAKILWAGLKLAFFEGSAAVLSAFTFLWDNAWNITKKFFTQLLTTAYNVFKKVPELLKAALTGGASFAEVLDGVLTGDLDLGSAIDGQIKTAKDELEALNAEAAAMNKKNETTASQSSLPQAITQKQNDIANMEEAKAIDMEAENRKRYLDAIKQSAKVESDPKLSEVPSIAATAGESVNKTKAIGTSSAAAVVAGALGFGNAQEETALNTKQTANYLRVLTKRPVIGGFA
jgi:hypothetical protein